ncbi:unnamed protein product [Peronospora belbahrii]|uniref:Uncharacterized protein n=1 Tax=Peronospora belbahrii TaxID=622444 RepID=A0AAU9LB82_9STRA|nr:unnamed protein product [Peronospora belbahrii]
MFEGTTRRSDALKLLYATYDSVPVKRHLKANAAMPANDLSEERDDISGLREFGTPLKSGLREFGTKLKPSLSTIIAKIRLKWCELAGKNLYATFEILKFHKHPEKLLDRPGFYMWLDFAASHNYRAYYIIRALEHYYRGQEDVLVKVLSAGFVNE